MSRVGGAPLGAPPLASRAPVRLFRHVSLAQLTGTLLLLVLVDALAIWFVYSLMLSGSAPLAIGLGALTVMVNLVFLSDRFYPIRWLAPGLVLMAVFVAYPAISTVFVAFTNYGDGHLLSKQQVLAQLEDRFYVDPEAPGYAWRAYRSDDGRFLLWLTDPSGARLLGDPLNGTSPVRDDDPRLGPRNEEGLPQTIDGFELLDRIASVQFLTELSALRIQDGNDLVRIETLDLAPKARQKYTYDALGDVVRDHETDKTYRNVDGTFTADDGERLVPGFTAVVGGKNFQRVLSEPEIRGPFFSVFLWTVTFAAVTVITIFSLGLAVALLLNERCLPLRGVWRSLAIVPYAIPGFISILVWVGLLNPLYGPFNLAIQDVTGTSPQWFSDPTLAKLAIFLVNLWLGYPYMMLITLGALQGIPSELYEAAQIDGAGAFARFRAVTLPLLLVSVGPLLIGSFAFNFNNFTLIELMTGGGPPITGTSTPAGHTDILLSYTFRLSFATGTGTQYGVAAVVTLLIFAITAGITALNFRLTRTWEKTSEAL